MFPHTGGQLPTHFQPPTSSQPANGAYNPPHINTSLPPPPPQEPRPDMAAHQHPHQQPPYRLPGPNEWTRAPPPPDPYRSQPPPANYMNHGHQPPAPRQRTAIACRYCRRRKIRCSGFEATDDGRCSNCMRFNQDCIFTPVSAQTQAFVPAHTVWRGVGQPPPMYGAYGQPLPPASHGEAYAQPPRQQQYLPSPTGATGPYPASSTFGSPSSAAYDNGSRDAPQSRKRPYTEPHTPTLPPPNPALVSQHSTRQSTGLDYPYPDPMSLTTAAVSPASSSAPYHSAPPPPAAQPYYAPQPPRRSSPQSPYPYETNGVSSSPQAHGGASTPGAAPYYAAPPPNESALRPLPARNDGRTPPPSTSQSTSRPGMRINDLVSDNGNGRSSTDSDMLNMLNRRPM
ncbi:hypothetical protein K469DRAFT_559044 [Zopfia rhizophila CBS 207.26]|uniref:Zn(2)-C6 fungal-type domain-containing protein n=1 Tax=Zopfia rhizophila CBS 207.26 TaxID=1314779 RepID=A0A6A6EIH0_9PEZI|nr:hypothetical protein K469DRAFT_559044 [Zopfia rhizophila CBS 207.26]